MTGTKTNKIPQVEVPDDDGPGVQLTPRPPDTPPPWRQAVSGPPAEPDHRAVVCLA